MNPIDIAARARANMDDSLYEDDNEITATYNTDNNNAKRIKRDSEPKVPKKSNKNQPPPSSLIISFKNQDGEDGGTPSVDLPVGTSTKQLELLINSLLGNQESV
jgi:hypothetical protein